MLQCILLYKDKQYCFPVSKLWVAGCIPSTETVDESESLALCRGENMDGQVLLVIVHFIFPTNASLVFSLNQFLQRKSIKQDLAVDFSTLGIYLINYSGSGSACLMLSCSRICTYGAISVPVKMNWNCSMRCIFEEALLIASNVSTRRRIIDVSCAWHQLQLQFWGLPWPSYNVHTSFMFSSVYQTDQNDYHHTVHHPDPTDFFEVYTVQKLFSWRNQGYICEKWEAVSRRGIELESLSFILW